ncbi:hypothetical protein AB0D34_37815 [Streptomyces sp. NPDC048420]|uniref:hypothetical protein n=1 Tax=Streptomyces sp. NPDC048420 TaxID=3155755 RepID=UPI00344A96DB
MRPGPPELAVHGAERRRGAGTRLLDAVGGAAKAEQRRSVIAQALHRRPVLALVHVCLTPADLDSGAIDALVELPRRSPTRGARGRPADGTAAWSASPNWSCPATAR